MTIVSENQASYLRGSDHAWGSVKGFPQWPQPPGGTCAVLVPIFQAKKLRLVEFARPACDLSGEGGG